MRWSSGVAGRCDIRVWTTIRRGDAVTEMVREREREVPGRVSQMRFWARFPRLEWVP